VLCGQSDAERVGDHRPLKNDVMNNTLDAAFVQNSVTVALLATAAGSGACNAATQPAWTGPSVGNNNLARGMKAWAYNLAQPISAREPAAIQRTLGDAVRAR
jgi:hypothetical protein